MTYAIPVAAAGREGKRSEVFWVIFHFATRIAMVLRSQALFRQVQAAQVYTAGPDFKENEPTLILHTVSEGKYTEHKYIQRVQRITRPLYPLAGTNQRQERSTKGTR